MITPKQASDFILTRCQNAHVIPVLVIDDTSIAQDLAKVFVDAGMPILEVTLRTTNALSVLEKMASVEGSTVGSGTVFNERQVLDSQSAGAEFIVSPGCTDTLVSAACDVDMPLLPGATTASEMMQLSEKGFSMLKFFPAEVNGGIPALRALSSPLPHLQFCPTGGVNAKNVTNYLSLPNVPVVGGSWLINEKDLADRNWKKIMEEARQVKALVTANHT